GARSWRSCGAVARSRWSRCWARCLTSRARTRARCPPPAGSSAPGRSPAPTPCSHSRERPRSTGASRTERARPSCAGPSRCVILGGRRTRQAGSPGTRRERQGPSPERPPTARRRETVVADPRSTIEEAGDQPTRPERLLELTEKHPQLHRLIVLNPSCPEVARRWILATNPWAKQAYEASLDDAPEGAEASGEPEGPGESEDPEDPGI